MFGKLFGGGEQDGSAADEAFADAKQAGLERALGPMDEMVLHSIIPFFMGGGLDLYAFSRCIPGKVIATQELIGRRKKDRPKKGAFGAFELVACVRPGVDLESEAEIGLVRTLLNPLAQYAFMAKLKPGDTAEIPMDDGEPSLGVLFGEFRSVEWGKGPFEIDGELFGLLLCVPLVGGELAFARREGGAALRAKLEAAGVWPYAVAGRGSVA